MGIRKMIYKDVTDTAEVNSYSQHAWRCGYRAAQKDSSPDDNPHPKYSTEYRAWDEGYWTGFYEESLEDAV